MFWMFQTFPLVRFDISNVSGVTIGCFKNKNKLQTFPLVDLNTNMFKTLMLGNVLYFRRQS